MEHTSFNTTRDDIVFMNTRNQRHLGHNFGIVRVVDMNGAMETNGHMCRFDMTQHEKDGTAHILKLAAFLVSVFIAIGLNCMCTNGHRHIRFQGCRPNEVQLYPDEVFRAMCRGMATQMLIYSVGLCAVSDSQVKCTDDGMAEAVERADGSHEET